MGRMNTANPVQTPQRMGWARWVGVAAMISVEMLGVRSASKLERLL